VPGEGRSQGPPASKVVLVLSLGLAEPQGQWHWLAVKCPCKPPAIPVLASSDAASLDLPALSSTRLVLEWVVCVQSLWQENAGQLQPMFNPAGGYPEATFANIHVVAYGELDQLL